jgi:hypothetical protein
VGEPDPGYEFNLRNAEASPVIESSPPHIDLQGYDPLEGGFSDFLPPSKTIVHRYENEPELFFPPRVRAEEARIRIQDTVDQVLDRSILDRGFLLDDGVLDKQTPQTPELPQRESYPDRLKREVNEAWKYHKPAQNEESKKLEKEPEAKVEEGRTTLEESQPVQPKPEPVEGDRQPDKDNGERKEEAEKKGNASIFSFATLAVAARSTASAIRRGFKRWIGKAA